MNTVLFQRLHINQKVERLCLCILQIHYTQDTEEAVDFPVTVVHFHCNMKVCFRMKQIVTK